MKVTKCTHGCYTRGQTMQRTAHSNRARTVAAQRRAVQPLPILYALVRVRRQLQVRAPGTRIMIPAMLAVRFLVLAAVGAAGRRHSERSAVAREEALRETSHGVVGSEATTRHGRRVDRAAEHHFEQRPCDAAEDDSREKNHLHLQSY